MDWFPACRIPIFGGVTLPETNRGGRSQDLASEIQKLADNKTANPHGRVHALWALAGLGKLKEASVAQAIEDKDWFVSMTGLRLAGKQRGCRFLS